MTDFAARLMALADELSAKLDSETEDRQVMAEHAERTVRQIAEDLTNSAATDLHAMIAAATDAEFAEIANTCYDEAIRRATRHAMNKAAGL